MERRAAGGVALAAVIVLAGPGAGTAGDGAPYRRVAGEVALSVRGALDGARGRLARERCEGILDELSDVSGRPLRAALDELSLSPDRYLEERIFFYDAEGAGRCRQTQVLALTRPGSRVVLVCGTRFTEARRRDPRLTEVVLIHETLHTLGLGENPPTTGEITSRVFARCGP